MTKIILISLLILLTPRTHSVAIRVNPHVLMEGGSISLTCVVDRWPENRWIDMGVTFDEGVVWQQSSKNLEGDKAPKIFEARFDGAPCGLASAFCIVSDSLGPVDRATAKVVVACHGQ